ncbi:MAG: ankyrin repeat domain-containing protein [Pontibacterium sp.]
MLNFLAQARSRKLISAIEQGDLDSLARLLKKFTVAELDTALPNQQSALEIAITAQQPKALELLLNQGCNASAPGHDGEPLLQLALKQPHQSLSLITLLLRAGANPNTHNLLHACFDHCPDTQIMVHLSRFAEHGAALTQAEGLIERALKTERLNLIHFLINSGVALPEAQNSLPCSQATFDYARRCQDDLKIRNLMQGC